MQSDQLAAWRGSFGQAYTDRNALTPDEHDQTYADMWSGLKKSDVYREFLAHGFGQGWRVLEVGCNVGNQLALLKSLDPTLDLYGVEPQPYALGLARQRRSDITFVPGSGFDLPFKDGWFDLVFTSVMLIHVKPEDLGRVQTEIVRCSKRHVLGHEYYAERPEEVRYYGHEDLLWKMNYAGRYLESFPELRLEKQRLIDYVEPATAKPLTDQWYLLTKA